MLQKMIFAERERWSHMTVRLILALLALTAFVPLPAQAQATMPVCTPGDPVVWVNTHTNVYHRSGDKFYGKTKAGMYACETKAVASGAHVSGSHRHGSMSAASPVPHASSEATTDTSELASPAPHGKHHRRHASPMPSATP